MSDPATVLTLLLALLPFLVPGLYAAQAGIYIVAYIAARPGLHAAWAYLASGLVHAALGAIYYWGTAGH